MSIARQGASFLVVGGCLVLVDWMVFVALTALGIAPSPANIAGRVVGALLGFLANGKITFRKSEGGVVGGKNLLRFLISWCLITLLSTYMVTMVADYLGLKMAWLAKPIVDGTLAVLTFFISRHWVYR